MESKLYSDNPSSDKTALPDLSRLKNMATGGAPVEPVMRVTVNSL